MPIEIIYIASLLAVICVAFLLFKRPIYECMFYGYILMLLLTGEVGNFFTYIVKTSSDTLFYSIICFLVLAKILDATHAVDTVVAVIVAVFGRFSGGAGLTAVLGSTFMGALSGSGAGNVATTGVFTIPAMIKSGFPRHLAANVECAASTMGNMIPPAGMIGIAFAALDVLYPNTYTMPQYWILLWGIAIWFVLQRIVTLYFMCRYYKVEPMKKEDLPDLKDVVKRGWKAVFLPIIVFVPFLLTSECEAFFVARLGAGAKALNNSLLLIIPALIVICGIFLSGKESRKEMTLSRMYNEITKGMLKVVPTAILVLFAYFVANVFEDLKIEEAIGAYFANLNMNRVVLSFLLPLLCAIMGMLLPGSSQVKIFGGIIITIMAAAGTNPMLVAAMLPCICGAMHGVTPPYCACVYVGMGIAQSELKPTLLNCAIWIIAHYLLSVLILLELLPVWGLIG